MIPAPFHAEIADGPPDSLALWLTARDGVRLRIAVWGREGARGTVLLFPGRTEYVEKYGRAAGDFRRRGFATLAVDWRGQGLADRLHPNAELGHVDRFGAYQRDVAALVEAAQSLGLPRPFYLLAHSMGGAIGLRALYGGLDVAAAVFSAPMWGIRFAPMMRPAAWALSAASRPLGLGGQFAPGTGGPSYTLTSSFAENDLTGDPEMFAHMRRQLIERPELALSGPSLTWLHEALRDTRDLARRPAPPLPTLTFLGTDERIVCARAIHDRMGAWPGGALRLIEGARHEVMMEGPDIRTRIFDEAADLFDRHSLHPAARATKPVTAG
ncbi:MAG: alpha/beta hydrolase [Rhodobacteraceae bacterium]|nr:alpha/beta hydrolase [Paracoccaceae bacterium]